MVEVKYELKKINWVEASLLASALSIFFTLIMFFFVGKAINKISYLGFYISTVISLVIVFKFLFCELFNSYKIIDEVEK